MCDSLIGTKHDIITELFELEELVSADATDEQIDDKMARISKWLCEPITAMHNLASELQRLATADIRYGLAFLLILESATNIINSVPAELLDAQDTTSSLTHGPLSCPRLGLSCCHNTDDLFTNH